MKTVRSKSVTVESFLRGWPPASVKARYSVCNSEEYVLGHLALLAHALLHRVPRGVIEGAEKF